MGCSFPLANAVVQRVERSVGRQAGALYLANTAGAVCGSMATGFVLLPRLGMQRSATVLTAAAALAIVPLYLASRSEVAQAFSPAKSTSSRRPKSLRHSWLPFAGSCVTSGVALWSWLLLPSDHLIAHAMVPPKSDERLLTVSEGLNEVVAVVEAPGEGRGLLTNGHAMSSTGPMSQRYMRALAHIPLLSIDRPDTVLIIGFGVGNTTHAATLHPSIRRVEVADLSRQVLAHAGYFKEANGGVLNDRRVVVYVNDGREHLQMQPAEFYDLITLEPPPIALSSVGALYSRELYALARTRLKPSGYISQWLPVYQVPVATTLAMIRAFLDVFPGGVLLSGADAELLLVGRKDSRVEIDPVRVAAALEAAPAVQADLQRVDLGSVREIAGTFVGSSRTLGAATRDSSAVTDDRPMQEYGVRSRLTSTPAGLPASVIDLSQIAAWCPTCFVKGKPVALAEGLDTYVAILARAYKGMPPSTDGQEGLADRTTSQMIQNSAYLRAVLDDHLDASAMADLHNVLGLSLAAERKFDEAIAEFLVAVRLDPGSAKAQWNMGDALAARGSPADAIDPLRRSVQLDPTNVRARYDLASTLLELQRVDEAIVEFRETLRLMPSSVEAHNNLGIALASQGKLDEAVDHFQQALRLQPGFADARRNLQITLQSRRRAAGPR